MITNEYSCQQLNIIKIRIWTLNVKLRKVRFKKGRAEIIFQEKSNFSIYNTRNTEALNIFFSSNFQVF